LALAATGVLVGVFSNTLVKLGIALVVGRGSFRKFVALGFGGILLVNAILIAFFGSGLFLHAPAVQ